MRSYLFILLSFVLNTIAGAQSTNQGKKRIAITNEKNVPMENVTVELLKNKDSSLVKVALTDKNGFAEFEKIAFGSYLLKATMVNYALQYSPVLELSALNAEIILEKLSLSPQSTQMSGVTVTSKKPFIQKLSDRLIVNVENSIVNAVSPAMDVLERSPGVSIDQNDVLGLRGRQGVIIMIDGKPSPMTGADLANYLRGLPSKWSTQVDNECITYIWKLCI